MISIKQIQIQHNWKQARREQICLIAIPNGSVKEIQEVMKVSAQRNNRFQLSMKDNQSILVQINALQGMKLILYSFQMITKIVIPCKMMWIFSNKELCW